MTLDTVNANFIEKLEKPHGFRVRPSLERKRVRLRIPRKPWQRSSYFVLLHPTAFFFVYMHPVSFGQAVW